MRKAGSSPVAATLAHRTETRLRLRIPDLRTTPGLVEEIADVIAEIAGVTRVLVRPHTASVIIECTAAAIVLEGLADRSVLTLRPAPHPVPVGTQAQFAMAMIDRAINKNSDGQWDSRSVMMALLLAAAVYQLMQGKLFGPVTTLSMSALSLMMASGLGDDGDAGDSGD